MKSKKMLATLLAAMLVVSTAFIGCGKKEETSAEPAETAIDADQTFHVNATDYTSLDPNSISDVNSFTTLTQVYEGLTREGRKNGVIVNELAGASKMEKSKDGLTYTFTLRDAKWSDGKPVTAKDYVYSWRRLADKTNAFDYAGFFDEIGVKNGTEIFAGKAPVESLGIEAKDDKTLVVTLDHPVPYFESALNFKCLVPVREDLVKALGDQFGIDYAKMVYNGPFTVTEYQKGSKIVYTKNDSYWDAKNIKLQKAECPIINEPATYLKMFDAGELDVTGASGDYLANMKKRAQAGEFQLFTEATPSVSYMVYNVKSKLLSNPKVRLAISLSFDRQQLLDTVYKRHLPAKGFVTPGITLGGKDYRKTVPEPLSTVKDDPKKILADGLKELGISDPSKAEVVLLVSQANSITTALAQFLQNQIQKNLGIKLTIKHTVDSPAYFKERTAGNFDICTGGWGADYNDLNSFFPIFTTGNNNNNGKYTNPKYDKLVADAAREMDIAKRTDLYKQAENLVLVEDAAVGPFLYQDIYSFRRNYVKGYYIPAFGGNFDLRGVYIQGKNK